MQCLLHPELARVTAAEQLRRRTWAAGGRDGPPDRGMCARRCIVRVLARGHLASVTPATVRLDL